MADSGYQKILDDAPAGTGIIDINGLLACTGVVNPEGANVEKYREALSKAFRQEREQYLLLQKIESFCVNFLARNGEAAEALDFLFELEDVGAHGPQLQSLYMSVVTAAANVDQFGEKAKFTMYACLPEFWTKTMTVAIQRGGIQMAKALLEPARQIAEGSDIATLMILAAHKDQPELLQLLRNKVQGDVTRRPWPAGKVTPLYAAAQSGSEGCLSLALMIQSEDGVNINAVCSPLGFTALHVAAYYGHEKLVEELLTQKMIDVTKKDRLGRMALHYAAVQGHAGVVSKLLLHRKSTADVHDHDGMTALHLAACGGHTHVIEELTKRIDGQTAMASKKAHDYKLQDLEGLFEWEYAHGSSPDDDHLQPDPSLISSVFWSPGAFTPSHYAAALHGERMLQVISSSATLDVAKMKDAEGLTAEDWARGRAYLQDYIEVTVEGKKTIGGELETLTGGGNKTLAEVRGNIEEKLTEKRKRAVRLMLAEVVTFEQKKREMEWCLDMCQALKKRNIVGARGLMVQASYQKLKTTQFGERISECLKLSLLESVTDEQVEKEAADRQKEAVNQKKKKFSWEERLEGRCLQHGIRKEDIEELMRSVCEFADFAPEVLEDWLKQAILFNFEGLAYDLIAIQKVNCIAAQSSLKEVSKKKADAEQPKEGAPRISRFLCGGQYRGEEPKKNLQKRSTEMDAFVSAMTCERAKMQRWMADRKDVRKTLYDHRQGFQDYLNTILVGAVLIAAAAYEGWLHPPSGAEVSGNEEALAHEQWGTRASLQVFWWFGSLSFFCAFAAVVVGARGAIPTSTHVQLFHVVGKMRDAVSVASQLLIFSVGCIVVTFFVAGMAVLLRAWHIYQVATVATMCLGVLACVVVLHKFWRALNVELVPYSITLAQTVTDMCVTVCSDIKVRLFSWCGLTSWIKEPGQGASQGALFLRP